MSFELDWKIRKTVFSILSVHAQRIALARIEIFISFRYQERTLEVVIVYSFVAIFEFLIFLHLNFKSLRTLLVDELCRQNRLAGRDHFVFFIIALKNDGLND